MLRSSATIPLDMNEIDPLPVSCELNVSLNVALNDPSSVRLVLADWQPWKLAVTVLNELWMDAQLDSVKSADIAEATVCGDCGPVKNLVR
jgi:hypothetical protein